MKTWLYNRETDTETEIHVKVTNYFAARPATLLDPPENAEVCFQVRDAAGNEVELTDEQWEEIAEQLIDQRVEDARWER